MAEEMKGITEDCLVFYDHQRKVSVNVIQLDKADFLPRVGEQVYLPGIDGNGQGTYKIDAIRHCYAETSDDDLQRGDVELLNITADVSKL